MRHSRAAFMFLLLAASVSCRKTVKMFDVTCPGFNSTRPIPEGSFGIEPPEKSAPVLYGVPRFNPTNANEIAFILFDTKKETEYLVKYNLVSKTMVKLAEGVAYAQLHWTIDGWIYYQGYGGIWRIKSDGDSLSMVTVNNDSIRPPFIVNRQGNRLAYITGTTSIVFNKHNSSIDTLPFYLGHNSWSYDGNKITDLGYHAGSNTERFGYYNVETKQFRQLPNMGANTIISDWVPDSRHIIWASGDAIFKTDTLGNTVKLTKNCINKHYLWPSVSPDGSKIIYSYTYSQLIEEDTVYTVAYLYMMNADGTDDHKIEIDYK